MDEKLAMKPYPKAADTPSRMARKHARYTVFMANKKIKAIKRKLRREAKEASE